MLRNITVAAKTALRNNALFCENGLFSVGSHMRLFSTEVALNPEPQPDKLYKRLEIELRGHDPEVLRSYTTYACMAAKYLDIELEKEFTPAKPYQVERLTLLKSKHVHKKHRVQYEIRTYYRYMNFLKLTGSTADTFLEYIQRNLPEGVAMKATKVEIKKFPEFVEQAVD